MTFWPILILALISIGALFGVAFVFARRLDNYGFVDVAWSYAFSVLAVFYAACTAGWPRRRLTIAVLVSVWSLRLGTHLFWRVKRHHPVEDARYRQLRANWAGQLNAKMAGFFQLQAVSVVLLGLPILLACLDRRPTFHALEFSAIALWLVAICGEAVADAQLARFSRNPANKGMVCAVGLWHYSRHPNYFFEWLIWVAYFCFALSSPWGWVGLIAPVAMLFLLLRVTGIPYAEAQSLQSRGDAYRRYQMTTHFFVPWFPRNLPEPEAARAGRIS